MTPDGAAPDAAGRRGPHAADGEAPSAPRPTIARVVVEVGQLHLDRPFDYLIGDDVEVVAGQRVMVPFAGRSVRG